MYRVTMCCQRCKTYVHFDSELPDVGNRYEYCAGCNPPRPSVFDIVSCVDMSDQPEANMEEMVRLGCGPVD